MRHEPLYQVDIFELEKSRDKKLSPEKELMKAVLEDALWVIEHSKKNNKYWNFVLRDTKYWINSNDGDWTFSFINVCETLGIDPIAVRKKHKEELK